MSGCTFDDAVEQHQRMLESGADLIAITDPRYPAASARNLRSTDRAVARGRIELLQTFMLAVVGTRRPTAYGMAAAERLSADLARPVSPSPAEWRVASTPPRIESTLAVGGDTVAVFGCGVDMVYPAENRKLADRNRRKRACCCPSFRCATPAYPQNFPVRNRIISGMSVGRPGGRGRPVQRLVDHGADGPGPAARSLRRSRKHHVQNELGPNLLIKQGAKLVQEWNDVMVELSPEIRRRADRKAQSAPGQLPRTPRQADG